MGSDFYSKRACNSDDDDDTDQKFCTIPQFDHYPEIRIHNGNWESPMFMAWVLQIVLMELVQVPATVGLSTSDTHMSSFYNPQNLMVYSDVAYPYEALETGHYASACYTTNEPCIHVMPEVWDTTSSQIVSMLDRGIIDTPGPTGLLGQSGPHIPTFTAEQHPGLAIWLGLAGEENRAFLAETFQRPTTWLEYCTQVSPSNCLEADATAARAPMDAEEEDLYFMDGLYTGHFRYTEKNNCTLHPTTCTGAIFGPTCETASNLESQLYWNDIVGLEMDGPIEPNGGYTNSQLGQLWHAANATKSHIIMYWHTPDSLPIQYLGTPFELQMVSFPLATTECLLNRVPDELRCSDDQQDRIGDPQGACRNPIQTLRHLIAKSVKDSNLDLAEADHSPAFDTINNIEMSNLDMSTIFHAWHQGRDAREAVCDWVVNNLDELWKAVPDGFPRIHESRSLYATWYLYMIQALAAFVGLTSLIAYAFCYKYRDTKTMIFAQPFFMMLILQGFLMITAGSYLYALEPTTVTCTVSAWLTTLGYTIELVPVLVKTAAINQLIQSSKKMKRVNLSRNKMLLQVAAIVTLIVTYMIVWTVLDPPTSYEVRVIANRDNQIVIQEDIKCASELATWRVVSFGWQALLLVLAAVLAFQSRHVMAQLNESKRLGIMVYSHFLFVSLRGICSFFYVYDTLPSSLTAAFFSINYSVDALFAMGIYVFPKIWEAKKAPGGYKPGRFSAESRFSKVRSSIEGDELAGELGRSTSEAKEDVSELKILVCSANVGNAEPTIESLEEWIPVGGACERITPLKGKTMVKGNFDLIAIGMQEATWTDSKSSGRFRARKGEEITEEEILNALEAKNTARLREMLQETLGDDYHQVTDEQRGQMRLHLWARRGIVRDITRIRVSGANTGIGNMLANKGGIVATLYYKNTRISFLSAHLAAHEGESYYKTRCENIRSILREAKTFSLSKKFDETMTAHHMFILGDLNFRTKFGAESKLEDNVKRALDLIEAKDYETLYEFDELHEGIAEGDLLVNFEALPCNFPPTFKVERDVDLVYKEQRTPSYPDRILYKSAEGLGGNLKALSSESCIKFVTSDHKPIRGAFSLVPNVKMEPLKVEGDLQIVFRKMRCSGLPAGDSDGKSDPYLMFLWDSVDLHSDNISLLDKIRELWLGRSWPRTSFISKTLNPYWRGSRMYFRASNTVIGADAMLFVAAIDFDAVGKDEFLGGTVFNVRELVRMDRGEPQKTISIDRPLTREGKFSGRLKCKIDVSISLSKRGSARVLGLGPRLASRMTLGKITEHES